METLTITLPKQYYASWTFPKDKVLSMFPQSLISTTLDISHEVQIELNHPIMTIQVMNILDTIVNYNTLSKVNPELRSGLASAGDYLGIDLLALIADSRWDVVDTKYNLLDPLCIKMYGKDLFHLALVNNYVLLVDYLIKLGVDPSSVFLNTDQPYIQASHYDGITYASSKGYIDMVERLLKDPRVDPTIHTGVLVALELWHLDVAARLLKDSRFTQDHRQTALYYACKHQHPTIVDLIMSDSKIDPSFDNNVCFRAVCGDGHRFNYEIMNQLLRDPRVDPSAGNNRLLVHLMSTVEPYMRGETIAGAPYGRIELLQLLVKDRRVIARGLSADNTRRIEQGCRYWQSLIHII